MAKKKNSIYLVLMEDGSIESFPTWARCEATVKGTSRAFVGGINYDQAYLKLQQVLEKKSNPSIKPTQKDRGPDPKEAADRPTDGLCSDGATSGNPGPSEYQVTDLQGNQIVHRKLGNHSNNYAELAGLGAMVKYAIASGESNLLWSDSKIAMGWVKNLRVGAQVRERDMILKMARLIHHLLAENPQLQLKKWHTRRWGEIPADFGRK